MKILTTKTIETTYIAFKVDHTKKEYDNFKLTKYVGWTKETNGKKYPVYEGYCKHCGTKVIIPIINLSKGKNTTKSCGCSRNKLSPEERQDSTINNPLVTRLFSKYAKTAKDRKLKFSLSKEEFYKLTQKCCYYCGRVPYQVFEGSGRTFKYNGIDRVDNKSGYNKFNVVPCCGKCNFMKHSLKQSDFISHIKLIYENLLPGHNKFDKFGGKPNTRSIPSQATA